MGRVFVTAGSESNEQFLVEGGYLTDSGSPSQYMREVSEIVQQLG